MKKTNKFLTIFILIIALSVLLMACSEKDSQGKIIIETPTNVVVSGDSISWDGVENAKKYMLAVKGVDVEYSEEFTTSMSPYIVQVDKYGTYSITIKAIGDGEKYGESAYSEPVTYIKTKKLSRPQVSIDNVNAKASWTAVENAESYDVIIKKRDKSVVKQFNTLETSFDFNNEEDANNNLFKKPDAYSIIVTALPKAEDKVNKKSDESEIQKYIKQGQLTVPKFDTLNSSSLWWNSIKVEGETVLTVTYEIKSTLTKPDGSKIEETYKSTGNNIGVSNFKLPEAGDYTLQIRALGDEVYKDSEYSAVDPKYTLTKLPMVKNVVYTPNGLNSTIKFSVDSLDKVGNFTVVLESYLADGSKSSDGTTHTIAVVRAHQDVPDQLEYELNLREVFYNQIEGGLLEPKNNDFQKYGRTYSMGIICNRDTTLENQGNNIIQSEKAVVDGTYSNYITPKKNDQGVYQIDHPSNFAYIRHETNANYSITKDMDFKGYVVSPISTFTGKIDGLNHIIKNLTIKGEGKETDLGIFTTLGEGSDISNLFIRDCKIVYNDKVTNLGILAGVNNGNISNIYVTGDLTPHQFNAEIKEEDKIFASNAGGLVSINKGTISDCVADVTVQANVAGGLVAINNGGISFSYALGKVSAKEVKDTNATNQLYAGGLIAINEKIAKDVMVNFSYAINKAEAIVVNNNSKSKAGGFIAINKANCVINQSFAGNMYSRNAVNLGEVVSSGKESATGGFAAVNEGTITNAYATIKAAGSGSGKSAGFVSNNSGTITNAYCTGGVEANGKTGGFVVDNTGTITNVYYTKANNSVREKEAVGTLITDKDIETLAPKLGEAFAKFSDKPAPVLTNMIYVSEFRINLKPGANSIPEAKAIVAGKEISINQANNKDVFEFLCADNAEKKRGNVVRAQYKSGSISMQVLVTIK